MLPTDIHFWLWEHHRREMLAEADRQRLLSQLPRRKCGVGLWRLFSMGACWKRMKRRACREGASPFLWESIGKEGV